MPRNILESFICVGLSKEAALVSLSTTLLPLPVEPCWFLSCATNGRVNSADAQWVLLGCWVCSPTLFVEEVLVISLTHRY